ncbi:MAG: nuclear transport factor 2 family protein [Deltaproteobacteria bacterium]
MTPENLIEIEQIRQLKARYFRMLDQKKWDEWEKVFCADVTIDTSDDGVPILHGRRQFRDFLAPILEGVMTVHHGHASEIEITGPDTATGIWAMQDMLWFPESKGGGHMRGTGWYFEKYRKDSDGEWRIRELVLRRIRTEMNGVQTFPKE